MSQPLSSVVISAVGLTCKAFLNSCLCSITVTNLPILLDALNKERRNSHQGLLTISNHLSTSVHAPLANVLALTSLSSLDDPLTWGVLPFENFTNTRTIRWVLGASDIMFTNPLLSAFFRKGQVIETFRGKGVWQPALDTAIEKLNQGHWLHMFAEGKVHQPSAYPQIGGIAHLPRFKWGVGRIIMETNVPPLVIPMWLTGFDRLMPEHRPFPYKYLPKTGIQLSVTFGDPIPPDKILAALNSSRGLKCTTLPPGVSTRHCVSLSRSGLGCVDARGRTEGAIVQAGGDLVEECESVDRDVQMDEIRSKVTAVMQEAVEELGRKVSGNKLGLPLPRHGDRGVR